MSRRRRRLLLAATALGAAAAGAAARRRELRWATGEDPCGPEGLALPEGESTTVTTDDDARLAVLTAGPADAPSVVLPHCWTGGMSMWAAVARRLVESGHRVVLYDQRGHGASTLGTAPLTTDRLGDDLRAVLTELDLTDVVLAGHSMGGMTVQALVARHPEVAAERVRGIALVATAAHTGLRVPRWVAEVMLGERRTQRLAHRDLGRLRAVVGVEAHRGHVAAVRDALVATTGEARAGFLVAMGRMDYRPALSTISVPTTVLVGTHDRLTPPPRARVLAGGIAGSELRVLPGLGHMLPLEAPDAVASAITELAATHVLSA